MVLDIAAGLCLLLPFATAWSPEWHKQFPNFPRTSRGHWTSGLTPEGLSDVSTPGTTSATFGNATFKLPINHSNPSLGTFDMFYYWSTEFWRGPGSPIVMISPSEQNITYHKTYLNTSKTIGLFAQKIGAAVLAPEHRYWGSSTPSAQLTTANLKYLTLDNAIADQVYFANKFQAPWDKTVDSRARTVPWVMSGASYSGALVAWTESEAPGTFWAYHASSAVVEAIGSFWSYYLPIQEGMAKNCSHDVSLVIEHMDHVFTHGSDSEKYDLKKMFRLESLKHNDDVMNALSNAPGLWQGNQFFTGYSPVFQWCDYVENAVNASASPGASGVGLTKALRGYATWFSEVFLPNYCFESFGYNDFIGTYNTACFDTYNASSPIFTDTSLANTAVSTRQWQWLLCNEPFEWFGTGAPKTRPTIVSRLLTEEYFVRQCSLYFPPGPNNETVGIAKGKKVASVNAKTKGWNARSSRRLIYTNGQYDPWRSATVSSDIRPGGPLKSTKSVPVQVVPGGFHASDMIPRNGQVNPGVQAAIDAEVQQIADWVAEWPGRSHSI